MNDDILNRKNCFTVFHPLREYLVMQAEDESIMKDWIYTLTSVVRSISTKNESST